MGGESDANPQLSVGLNHHIRGHAGRLHSLVSNPETVLFQPVFALTQSILRFQPVLLECGAAEQTFDLECNIGHCEGE